MPKLLEKFHDNVNKRADATCWSFKNARGEWEQISWTEAGRRVQQLTPTEELNQGFLVRLVRTLVVVPTGLGCRRKGKGAPRDIIRVTDKAFDDFADGGSDLAANRKILGIG